MASKFPESGASSARIQILEEVATDMGDSWKLCFQWCRYVYDNGALEQGYRFIWRRPDNSLQAARGQARLPSIKVVQELICQAEANGWGKNQG